MPDNLQKTKGRTAGYKFDRGGSPTEFGPYIGKVTNNIDPTRSGRLQVYIEQFAGEDETDESLWRTVSYVPPWYGVTPHTGTGAGAGTFTGNQQSYGMWFTPPDLGTQVICFFVAGDPNQGYYTGCVPEVGISHMIPAIGASTKYQLQNGPQDSYFQGARQLPVTEINTENLEITENPRFFDQPKPVHSYVSGILMQQGLIRDTVRGPITSNSQRETPSAAFGLVTPGQAIYQGGLNERDIKAQLDSGSLRPQDVKVIARRGGHSIVMDDGDLEGKDNLVRIRTAKGHQITMSDDGDCFYIIHANGQTWLEFGKQGTVDVFSTNSVNIRTQGTINLHADKDINMYAGGSINAKTKNMKLQAEVNLDLIGDAKTTIYSKSLVGLKSDGSLFIKSASSGAWDAGSSMNLVAGCINLNSGGSAPVDAPTPLRDISLPDTVFKNSQGWVSEPGKLKTVVTRAPTHEPYAYHNQGVNSSTALGESPPVATSDQAAATVASLQDEPVTNGIDQEQLLSQEPAEISVGSLDTPQVTGLLAQTAADVDQPFTAVSTEKGIGKFGFQPDQLEAAGYLKPGTVETYLSNPAQLTSVLASPGVWTGKSGVDTLANLLGDEKLQNLTQNEIMVGALQGLRAAGVVTGLETPADLGMFVQNAAKFGVNTTVDWVKGQAPSDLVQQLNTTARNAQFAVQFVDEKSTGFTNVLFGVGGFVGTTRRVAVDEAVVDIIGDEKVPAPIYNQDTELVETTSIVEETGGGGESVTISTYGQGVPDIAQQITDLENEIYQVEASIRFRTRRGRDTADLQSKLADLQAVLASLKQG
jgi:hypothetical protein